MNSRDLGGPILKAVSRSFYLSVRILPSELRAPVGLAYLLARASDTIADSASAAPELRLHHLAAFDRMVQTGSDHGMAELQRDIQPTHEGESALIARLSECLVWLHSLPENDQAEIRAVLAKIIHGQTLDLQRFPEETATSVRALKTADELEEYTYLVAGCVGEFWTRISVLHRPDYSPLALTELSALGIDYGKGLQLVNILRDMPSDLRQGRCYLPADELTAAGAEIDQLLTHPSYARPVFTHWLDRASHLLDAGRQYIQAIRPARVRIACYLPWYLGKKTLDMLQQQSPLETPVRLKVSRKVVRSALLRAPIVAWSNRPLAST
ncbi:phytoene/squalene synthase family protein [Verrucomicrobiota bacterium sgz303538]